MNLNVSTYPTIVKGMTFPLFTVVWQLQMCLYSSPQLGKHAECSQLQENVYFMGSILSRYQSRVTKVSECLVRIFLEVKVLCILKQMNKIVVFQVTRQPHGKTLRLKKVLFSLENRNINRLLFT